MVSYFIIYKDVYKNNIENCIIETEFEIKTAKDIKEIEQQLSRDYKKEIILINFTKLKE